MHVNPETQALSIQARAFYDFIKKKFYIGEELFYTAQMTI